MTSGLVYEHMSSHYRRILNAKPTVDTSTPQSMKQRQLRLASSSRKYPSPEPSDMCSVHSYATMVRHPPNTREDLALIDRIVDEDKYSPTDVCRLEWSKTTQVSSGASRQNSANHAPNQVAMSCKTYVREEQRKPMRKIQNSADVIEKHKDQFEALGFQFWPRILKSNTASKLRDMRVYHPPRRRNTLEKTDWNESERDKERSCGCREECHCGDGTVDQTAKEPSQASSRDSAYNGGTSSTPDSRSPTPCQQKVANHVRHVATQTDLQAAKNAITAEPSKARRADDDDFAYTKFIHDITVDVVEKGQFTDKSLSRVIRRHVAANLNILDKGRMQEEILQLREQLRVPPNKDDFTWNNPTTSIKKNTSKSSLNSDITVSSDYPESWTAYYMRLQEHQDETERTSVSEGISYDAAATESLFTADGDDGDEEAKDSDSSREATIKEVLHTASWQQAESDSEREDLEEAFDIGPSHYSEDDLSE